MAHVTALARGAPRTCSHASAGTSSEQGLIGAPAVHVVASEERHTTIDRALRFLGLGTGCVVPVEADEQGRDAARTRSPTRSARLDGPDDRVRPGGQREHRRLRPARARSRTPPRRPAPGCTSTAPSGSGPQRRRRSGTSCAGVERADSWATDAHKWLNVPYDNGLAFCAHPDAHRAAMGVRASYLIHADADGPRDQLDWNPEFSRRARGFAVYAALRSLGRSRDRGARRALLRPRAALRGHARRGRGRRDPERRGAEPGARALRRRRRDDAAP